MSDSRLSIRIANTTKFTGREGDDWEKWVSRFETRFCGEDDNSLASILRDVLDGVALDVCSKLGKETCQNYAKVKTALQSKFGKTSDPRHAHAELRHAQQGPGESAEAYGERILRLTRAANPDATEKQLQKTALEHFMCGLSDLHLQERLHTRDDIVSLDVAIMAANKYKEKEAVLASMRTTQGNSMAMAACRTAPPAKPDTRPQDSSSTHLLSAINDLKKEVKEIKTQMQGTTTEGRKVPREQQGCYQCGDFSHFKRDCPTLGRSPQHDGQSAGAGGARPKRQAENQPQCVGCGRRGHWLSECWRTPTSAGGAGRRRAVRNEPGAQCIGCGRPGHWMAECWGITAPARSSEPWQQASSGTGQGQTGLPRQPGPQLSGNE